MTRTHDFDAAWAEAAGDAPTIRVMGETITLPPALAAAAVLEFERRRMDPDSLDVEAGLDSTVDFVGALVGGREHVDRWLSRGMTLPQLLDVARLVPSLYHDAPDDEDGDGPGEASPPQRGRSAGSSSKSGRSSKRTSTASTTRT